MTIEDYKELLLQDELKIGYGIPEDEFTDEIDEDSYIDGLLTDGMIPVDASEMFGEEVIGYSLYWFNIRGVAFCDPTDYN